MSNPIDFVITWVDGNDPKWKKKKDEALGRVNTSNIDARKRRSRDWNNLQYFFRGVAKYAPWVNHIYIVTPGQCPLWLDTNHPKISIINQDDLFEDKSILPTFNNCAIELLFHKIPGLSEQFVYFNDDMFILNDTKETDFFKDGLPCVTAALSPILPHYSEDGKGTYGNDVMNFRIVAKHFNKKDVIKKNWKKYFDLRNGREIIKTILCIPYTALPGFNDMHIAYSYLKSTYDKVWEIEGHELSLSCKERFRGDFSLYHNVMRYWQMADGKFSIRRRSFSKMFDIQKKGEEEAVIRCINNGKPVLICINDNVCDEDFDYIVDRVNNAFEKKFFEKCEFEL